MTNKTVTYLSAGSQIVGLSFDISPDGLTINATVSGRAPLAGGGFGPVSTYPVVLTSGAIFTAVTNLATGGALTFWQGKEGL